MITKKKELQNGINKPVSSVAPAFPAEILGADISRFVTEVFSEELAATQRRICTSKRAEAHHQ